MVRACKKGLEFIFVRIIYTASRPIGRLLLRFVVLPIYQLIVLTKLRIQRLALPARGFMLFLVTNKYLFHIAIGSAAAISIFVNLQNRQALAQDAGQRSLLYTLMTNGESEVVQEEVSAQDAKADAKRLGQGTIEAMPHIDFDYERTPEAVEDTSLSQSLPGTVVMRPENPQGTTPGIRPSRTGIETYVVKEGDTLGSIARDYDLDVGTILWANDLSERQYIRPGDSLRILPVSGVTATVKKGDTLSAIADRYNGDLQEIMRSNQLTSELVPVGRELIIPDGEPPAIVTDRIIAVARQRSYASSDRTSLQENISAAQDSGSDNLVETAAPAVAKPRDATEAPEKPKTKLFWPTSGHVITQYYGWKHTGLDIDGDYTSPLYAADDGVVTTAGWNKGGYGLMILIDHPNGIRTRYGHSSKLFVKVGDKVKRGQVIAMMGSTGRSTGSHLHFEVYVNGKRVNPLTYIR